MTLPQDTIPNLLLVYVLSSEQMLAPEIARSPRLVDLRIASPFLQRLVYEWHRTQAKVIFFPQSEIIPGLLLHLLTHSLDCGFRAGKTKAGSC